GLSFDRADAVDVVLGVHGAQDPLIVLVERTEEDELDDHAVLLRRGHQLLEPFEIRLIEAGEIELVSPVRVALRVAPSPRCDEAVSRWGERVPRDVERSLRLDVSAAEDAREVETLFPERLQVALVVEVEIEERAVMLARCDEDHGLAIELEVARVRLMEPQRWATGRGARRISGRRRTLVP